MSPAKISKSLDPERLRQFHYTDLDPLEKRFGYDPKCENDAMIPSRPAPKPWRRVVLELSLKPFYDPSPEARDEVLRTIFNHWMPLIMNAKAVGLQFWIGDGSDLLEYRGRLEDQFEWACYQGKANDFEIGTDDGDVEGMTKPEDDPDGIGLHQRAYLYRPNPPRFTYAWLKELVDAVKRIGAERLPGKRIEAGMIFEATGEFSYSHFKYKRHREICLGGTLFDNSFVGCTATMKGDALDYAGFPDGIPDGISLGTFLGRQLKHYTTDLGFDFVWFSNGFGFGTETWGLNGRVFEKGEFLPERVAEEREKILRFWKDFRAEVPDLPVRTRGTNLTSGVDMASDGTPLSTILREFGPIDTPVNSPWAAIDGDFGLELSGWMSHVAASGGESYPFRFYTHDPWWMNSPWLDRYQRKPHDIFLPLTVSRLLGDGRSATPDLLNFLTIDNSHGEMPEMVPHEVIAAITAAREFAPDEPGDVVWVYPLTEYEAAVFGDDKRLSEVNFGDWYVRGCINNGFPLNTVVNSDDFRKLDASGREKLKGRILFAPVPPAGSELETALLAHRDRGGDLILYGPLSDAHQRLRELLGVETVGSGVEGDFNLSWGASFSPPDRFESGSPSTKYHHGAIMAGGGLREQFAPDSESLPIATASGESGEFALGAISKADSGKGRLAWLRGGVTCDETRMAGPLPAPLSLKEYFPVEALARVVLDALGYHFSVERLSEVERSPIWGMSRCRNSLILAMHAPGICRNLEMRLPLGMPIAVNSTNRIRDGKMTCEGDFTFMRECRIFIEQEAAGVVICKEIPPHRHAMRRCVHLRGLENATVRFLPETGYAEKVSMLRNPRFPWVVGDFLTPKRYRASGFDVLEVEGVSGELLINWKG